MNKIEYGDLYKFQALLGVALIALAMLVPWLFLKEPFHLLVEADKLKLLSPDIQEVLATRTAAVAFITTALPWISGVCLGIGVLVLWLSLSRWRPKQQIQDDIERLEKQKKEQDLKPMNEEEVRKKSEVEAEAIAADEVLAHEDAGFGLTISDATAPEELRSSRVQFAQRYRELEIRVVGKLYDCFAAVYRIRPNMRLGITEYDCILESKIDQLPDVVVELKYSLSRATVNSMIVSVRRLAQAWQNYRLTTKRDVVPLLLYIVPRTASLNAWDKYRLRSLEEASRLGVDVMKIHFIYDEELDEMSCANLSEIIGIFSTMSRKSAT